MTASALAERIRIPAASIIGGDDSLRIVTPHFNRITDGVPFAQLLEAAGAIGPVFWTIQAGCLPDGLVLNCGTGEIKGTVRDALEYDLTIRVTDSAERRHERQYTGLVGASA